MQVLSNLNFKNSTITLDQLNDFPINPKLGTIILKDDGLYLFFNERWINLLKNSSESGSSSSFVFNQETESDQWHITHNLNTQDLFAVVYDSDKILNLSAGIEFINDNEINLNFVDPIKGKAIIFAASSITDNSNVNIDNITIIKNDNNTLSVNLEGLVDNETIIIDDNGKLKIKSNINYNTINYIDEDTDIDTLVTPGLYVTRNGRFTNAPIKMIRNDGSVSENTYQYVPVLDVDEFGDILNVYTDTVTGKIRQVFYSAVLPSPVFRTIGSNALDRYWAFNNQAYACTDNGTMGNVFADGTTIKADKFGSLSVVPEGLVDNDTILVEDGKIKSKSVPFDGGSIFACLAGNGEGSWTDEGESGVNQQFRPNLSDASFQKSLDGKSFCHVENNAIVLDEDGFYIVRLRRAFYPGAGNTGTFDLTESISHKGAGGSIFYNIGTHTVEMNNNPDLWNYVDFNIVLHGSKGDSISSLTYGPIDANLRWYSGSYGLYVFKIPTTNEYQVSNSEYMGIYQTQYTITQTTQNPDNQNQKYFDIRWDTDSAVNEFPDRLAIKNNIELVPYKSGIVLWNFSCSISTADGTNVYDLICQVYRKGVDGSDVLVRSSTFSVDESQLNSDIFNLFILLPMQENESIWFRIFVPSTLDSIAYSCSMSATVLPSVAASVQNGSAYRTITLTADDNIDNLTPGSYYKPSGVTPQGILPYTNAAVDYTLVVYGTDNTLNLSYKQVAYSQSNFNSIVIREVGTNNTWTTWKPIIGICTNNTDGLIKLATQDQAIAGTESGAYALTPATGKQNAIAAIENELNSDSSTINNTISNIANSSAYTTRTLTDEDNIDNLKPGCYYKPSGVTPQGTLPTFSSVDRDYVIMVYGTSNSEINESFKQTIFSADNFYRIVIREFLNGAYTQWFNILGNSTTTNNGIAYLATDEQIVAGVETGARIVTPAGAKLAIRTFAAPMPTASEGLGNWYLVAVNDSKFTLKSGGTWAYFALGYANGGAVISTTAGIEAGGQTIQLITASEAPIVSATGFAWQIQKN